jgi:hypothetical protein
MCAENAPAGRSQDAKLSLMNAPARSAVSGWALFLAWSVPGIVLGLQVSVIGVFLALPGILVAWLLWRQTGISAEVLGLVAGVGLTSLFIAWRNAGSGGLDARPWAIGGAVLVGIACVIYAVTRHRSGKPNQPGPLDTGPKSRGQTPA